MPTPQVQHVDRIVAMAGRRFTYGLEKVPDDRLNWSPGGVAKTPLQLADKLCGFLRFLSYVFAHGARPEGRPEPSPPSTTREEATQRVNECIAALRQALASVDEERLAAKMTAPWGEITLQEALSNISGLILYHQGQLNYAQMAYGDEDANIPPNWGSEEI